MAVAIMHHLKCHPARPGGIAINILHHYIDTLKETLIADADTLTDENADYCVAIGTTTLLPERFAEYVKIINLIQYPFCLQRLD
ncbi:hypothetical protein LRM35_22880 [Klebsiella variicola subsp. variicola]|nr:hypothetical protein LRM35_22880 [Klebsiella variicola subsp. variicola]WMJ65452.1 hypothetical protein RBI80_26735 [Klebsiella variicola]